MSSGSVSSAAASSTTSAGQLSPGSLQPTTSTPNVVGSRGRLDGAAELAKESNFSAEEIQRLYKRFMKMDKDRSGAIDKEEFLSLPQIANNPLAQRLMAIFDEDGGGDIDFKEFIKALSVFSAKGNKLEKLRFAFKVYDMDGDGFISNGELFLVLKMMVGNNLRDNQLQQIVDKTIMESDCDSDGKISFEEFAKCVGDTDIARQMTLESGRF